MEYRLEERENNNKIKREIGNFKTKYVLFLFTNLSLLIRRCYLKDYNNRIEPDDVDNIYVTCVFVS